jgi:predicted RNase H-like HicB family nuclease
VKPARFPYVNRTHTDAVAVERSSNYICVPQIIDDHDKTFAARRRTDHNETPRRNLTMSKQEPTITLTENEDGWWTARNVKVGVSSQGETKQEALENLGEAVELTQEVRDEMDDAPEPSVPWFDNEEEKED